MNGQGAWACVSCVRGVKEKVALFLQWEGSSGVCLAPVPLYVQDCNTLIGSKTAHVCPETTFQQ